jgi:hypothetical protein
MTVVALLTSLPQEIILFIAENLTAFEWLTGWLIIISIDISARSVKSNICEAERRSSCVFYPAQSIWRAS